MKKAILLALSALIVLSTCFGLISCDKEGNAEVSNNEVVQTDRTEGGGNPFEEID